MVGEVAELRAKGFLKSFCGAIGGRELLAAVGTLGFFGVALVRFETLNSATMDLGYFDQVIWNASQGRGFTSSFIPYSFLGLHFSPALALFVPLYKIHSSPVWLLAAQSLALGLAVVPLHDLAAGWLGRSAANVASAAYLVQLFVLRAVVFDFHTEALAVPFVFAAVLAAVRGRDGLLLLAGSVPLLCKEDGAMISFGIGLIALLVGRRGSGIALMVIGVACAIVVTVLVMPTLRGGAPGILDRYAYLGNSVPAIALGLVTHPGAVAAHLLDPLAVGSVALMLLGLGLLPLLRPAALLAALPPILLAVLSDSPYQHVLVGQYGLQPGPLLVVAALLGWRRLTHLGPRPAVGWTVLVLAVGILFVGGPRPELTGWEDRAPATAVLSQVPPTASLAGSSGILTWAAERREFAEAPGHGEDYVVLDERSDLTDRGWLAAQGYVPVARSGPYSLWRRVPPKGVLNQR